MTATNSSNPGQTAAIAFDITLVIVVAFLLPVFCHLYYKRKRPKTLSDLELTGSDYRHDRLMEEDSKKDYGTNNGPIHLHAIGEVVVEKTSEGKELKIVSVTSGTRMLTKKVKRNLAGLLFSHPDKFQSQQTKITVYGNRPSKTY